ncbi:MAG: enoyl-CoA hydratase-related protein [Hyphomonadaceae bacterium]|nr:enoyl-CoA hydratase-related protein [Hyphomonadaceae bacterium]
MSEPVLKFERLGAVAKLTLNRPETGNAINLDVVKALMDAGIACDEDESIRCVILTGAGRMFSVGGDIVGFREAGDGLAAHIKLMTSYFHVGINRLMRMPKPLVTAINGTAAGGGLSLAILGDIALAARSAQLTVAYSAIGLTSDGGASYMLPRLVGMRKAQEMMLLNPRLSAEEAASAGLITRVVEDAALQDEAMAVAERLAASATGALGRMRQLLLQSYGATLEQQMETEARLMADCARSPHGKAGVDAFLNKRKPEFL